MDSPARGDVDDELGLPPLAVTAAADGGARRASGARGAAGVVGGGRRRAGLLHRVAHALQLGALVAVALQPGGQRTRAVRRRAAAGMPQQSHRGHDVAQVGILVHLVAERRVGVAEVVLARLVQAVPVSVLRHPRREVAARARQVRCGEEPREKLAHVKL